ncbi:hypothetical protein LEMLEM_LOCUS8830 [Lemmus lemmus]
MLSWDLPCLKLWDSFV